MVFSNVCQIFLGSLKICLEFHIFLLFYLLGTGHDGVEGGDTQVVPHNRPIDHNVLLAFYFGGGCDFVVTRLVD